MFELSPNISEQDRKEVERRIAALDKPARKRAVNQGFNKPECYGMSYPMNAQSYSGRYADKERALYNYVMSEMGGQL